MASGSSSNSSNASAPASLEDLRDRLAKGELKLPKRLAQTAKYLVANPEEVAFGTVASLSHRAGVQPSALIRMAQSVGFSGFSDLQALFRQRLRDKTTDYGERLSSTRARKGSISAGLLREFGELGMRSIGGLMESADPLQLEGAVATLAKAGTIFLIGQRRSFPVTAYIGYLFNTLGIRNMLLGSPIGTDVETIKFATPNDAALVVTFAPYAPSTISQAEQAAEQKCPLILVTDSPLAPLVPLSRHWLEIVEPNLDGFRTMSATFTLAATLAVAVAGSRDASRT